MGGSKGCQVRIRESPTECPNMQVWELQLQGNNLSKSTFESMIFEFSQGRDMDLFPGGYSNLERFIDTSSKSLYLLANRDKPFLLTCFVANAKFKLFFHSPFRLLGVQTKTPWMLAHNYASWGRGDYSCLSHPN